MELANNKIVYENKKLTSLSYYLNLIKFKIL